MFVSHAKLFLKSRNEEVSEIECGELMDWRQSTNKSEEEEEHSDMMCYYS